jgi:psp operon transcriptional activator
MQDALGQSDAFLTFTEQLSRVARVDRPVLLIGERGSGKELAAAKLHYLSSRWEAPLVALNCAALAPALIEAELFGHERGAFTGAVQDRAGRFEAADGGTLMLDEIGLIPIEAQEKILRAVEYGSFERVGSSRPTSVDVRIIGATNADLPALARSGRFKEDLLDRLSFEVLHVPPLRERRDDILLLARHFAARMAAELGLASPPEFSRAAAAALLGHPWPGNVRELKNVVERAVYRAGDGAIGEIVFDPFARTGRRDAGPALPVAPPGASDRPAAADSAAADAAWSGSLHDAVARVEVAMLRRALAECRHHQRRAAERLGLTYHQFRGLYRKHARVLAAPSAGLAAGRDAPPAGPPVQAAPLVVPGAKAGGDAIDVARGPRG